MTPSPFRLVALCAAALALSPAALAQQAAPAKPEGQQPRRSQTPARPQTATPAETRAAPAAKPAQAGTTAAKPAPGRPQAGTRAAAATAGGAAAAALPGGAQAKLLETFGDWSAYTTAGSGRSKLCYALTQPKDRQPKTLNRDPGYLFVSFRPAENVRNEVALMMGFPTQDGGAAEAAVGSASYALITKDTHAWLKNPAEEAQAIATMSRGQSLVVKAASKRGNQSTDRYSLNGFGQALERARKECS